MFGIFNIKKERRRGEETVFLFSFLKNNRGVGILKYKLSIIFFFLSQETERKSSPPDRYRS